MSYKNLYLSSDLEFENGHTHRGQLCHLCQFAGLLSWKLQVPLSPASLFGGASIIKTFYINDSNRFGANR